MQPQECRRRVGAALSFGRPGRRGDPQQQADHQTLPQQAAVLHGQGGRLAGADQPGRLRACQKRGQGAPRTVLAGLIERLGHHMMQRLVAGLHPLRLKSRRDRLDALALAWQQQTRAIGPRRGRPARVP